MRDQARCASFSGSSRSPLTTDSGSFCPPRIRLPLRSMKAAALSVTVFLDCSARKLDAMIQQLKNCVPDSNSSSKDEHYLAKDRAPSSAWSGNSKDEYYLAQDRGPSSAWSGNSKVEHYLAQDRAHRSTQSGNTKTKLQASNFACLPTIPGSGKLDC